MYINSISDRSHVDFVEKNSFNSEELYNMVSKNKLIRLNR